MPLAIGDRKGFTLVELMIVVAIIGILAAIAIPNFLQFRMKAKTSEAKANLGAIRSAELAYFAEWNLFVANQLHTPVLDRTHDTSKVSWNSDTRFSILGFEAERLVYYSYELLPNTASGGAVDHPTSSQGYTARATADLDDDGDLASFTVNHRTGDIVKSGGIF